MQTESQIQTEILNYLRAEGFFCWKNHTGGIRKRGTATVVNPNKGAPDIFAIRQGTFYGIEVKKPGGKAQSHQLAWLEKLRQHGGIAIICDSVESCIEEMRGANERGFL